MFEPLTDRVSVYLTEALHDDEQSEQLDFILPHPIDFGEKKYECALVEASFDISWYNIVDGHFSYNSGGSKKWEEVSIPEGTYENLKQLLAVVSKRIPGKQTQLKPAQKETQLVLRGPKDCKIRLGHDLAFLLGLNVGSELNSSKPIPIPNVNLNWNMPEVTIEAPNLVRTSMINDSMRPILALVPTWPTQHVGFQGTYSGPPIFRDVYPQRPQLKQLQIMIKTSKPFQRVI